MNLNPKSITIDLTRNFVEQYYKRMVTKSLKSARDIVSVMF